MENTKWYCKHIELGRFDNIIFDKELDEFNTGILKNAILARRKILSKGN